MKYIVTVNDKQYEVEVEQGEARVLAITAAQPAIAAASAVPAAAAAPVAAPAAPIMTGSNRADGTPLTAPMPGTILAVLKKPGDRVKPGDIVIILEAMKMENEIVATCDGTISQVLVGKGSTVTTGDSLVMIA